MLDDYGRLFTPNPVIGATYPQLFEQKVAHKGVLSSTSLI